VREFRRILRQMGVFLRFVKALPHPAAPPVELVDRLAILGFQALSRARVV